jgi:hypothetical protein
MVGRVYLFFSIMRYRSYAVYNIGDLVRVHSEQMNYKGVGIIVSIKMRDIFPVVLHKLNPPMPEFITDVHMPFEWEEILGLAE